jgi:hypothetical protein
MDSNALSSEPLDPPEITVTSPSQGDVAEPRPSTSNDVDCELLALLEEPSHSAHPIPAFFAPPPVREAAKKSGKAIGKIPITTTTVKTAPIVRLSSSLPLLELTAISAERKTHWQDCFLQRRYAQSWSRCRSKSQLDQEVLTSCSGARESRPFTFAPAIRSSRGIP